MIIAVAGLVTVVGFIAAFVMAAREARGVSFDWRRAMWGPALVAVITLVFWAISTRTAVPFSPGQSLGIGFLIGGILGAIYLLAAARLSVAEESVRVRYLTACAGGFMAILGLSIAFILFKGYPQPAVIGYAIGTAMAAIIGYYGRSTEAQAGIIEIWAIFAITAAAGLLLSVQHYNADSLRSNWPVPILLGLSAVVAAYVGSEIASVERFRDRLGTSYAIAAVISAAIMIGLCAIFSWKLVETWQLLSCVAAGVLAAALISWIAATSGKGAGLSNIEAGAAAALIVAAFAVVGFKIWSGLGIAVGLIGAMSVVIPSIRLRTTGERSPVFELFIGASGLTLMIALFTLFIDVYRSDLRAADLRIHYTFVGALLGVIIPFVLASALSRRRTLFAVLALGLVAVASPIALLFIWEIKAVMGFIFGLAAAGVLSTLVRVSPFEEIDSSPALLIIGSQLVAIQFLGSISEIELVRSTKVWVVAGIAAVILLWLVVEGIIARRGARQ